MIKRLLCIPLIFLMLLLLTGAAAVSRVETFLVVGFDDANANTDVMALVRYSPASGMVSVLQIPRDTYTDAGTAQNKINQIYPHALAGSGERDAMETLRDTLSDQLGVHIDRFVAVSTDSFVHLIDALGGISLHIPDGVVLDGITGEPGETVLLDGAAALQLVRQRSQYASGDLGRIDAQKLFISALLHRVGEGFSIGFLRVLYTEMHAGMITDITLPEAVGCAWNFMMHFADSQIYYMNLPGAAIQKPDGPWYYVANRAATQEVLSDYFGAGSFDPGRKLCPPFGSEFRAIYEAEKFEYRIYTDDELSDIRIP